MLEVRFHGRGGQGAVTAAQLLAVAAFKCGSWTQAFPHFGVERRGAPVEAFCRINDKPIDLRTHVYSPDIVVVLDSDLVNTVDVADGLVKKGRIILNAEEFPKKWDLPNFGFKINLVNATAIALDIIGKPIVNTAMLGAFAKVTEIVTLKSVQEAIKEWFPKEVADKNCKAVEEAYNSVR